MLPTADVVNSVIFAGGVAQALAGGVVWAQMGTIGVAATTEIGSRLGQLRPDVMFVDAPVSGSKGPAEAGQLLLCGVRQAEVANRLHVSRETVRRWAGKVGEGGLDALKNAPRLGRPAGLDAQQRETLAHLLQQGGMAHGFATDSWSLNRVRQLIERQFGRSYSEVQVWRILGALGWSHQPPAPGVRRSKRRQTREWMQKR